MDDVTDPDSFNEDAEFGEDDMDGTEPLLSGQQVTVSVGGSEKEWVREREKEWGRERERVRERERESEWERETERDRKEERMREREWERETESKFKHSIEIKIQGKRRWSKKNNGKRVK